MATATARKAAAPATVRIKKEVNSALNSAARDLKITKARLVQNALIEYLEDLADRKAIKTHRGEPTIAFAELRKRLGLWGRSDRKCGQRFGPAGQAGATAHRCAH